MSTTEVIQTDDGAELVCIGGACYRTDTVQKSLRVVHRRGSADDEHINIRFQEGPIEEVGVNGTGIEDVIDVLIDRLRGFNADERTRCRENSLAITELEKARNWLTMRTINRILQGVEGYKVPHDDHGQG